MKNKILYVIILIVIGLTITGCSNNNKKTSKKAKLDTIGIEEGCYYTKSDNRLICFDKNANIYSVLKNNDEYLYDKYYFNPPKDSVSNSEFKAEYSYSENSFSIKFNRYDEKVKTYCQKDDNKAFTCMLKFSDSDAYEIKKYAKYEDEILIDKLQIYNRSASLQIDFYDETIDCKVPWEFSFNPENIVNKDLINSCFKEHFDEEYTFGCLDEDNKNWYIASKTENDALQKLLPYKGNNLSQKLENIKDLNDQIEFSYEHFNYNVTVNDILIGTFDNFPINLFEYEEKVTIKIQNINHKDRYIVPEHFDLALNEMYVLLSDASAYIFYSNGKGEDILYPGPNQSTFPFSYEVDGNNIKIVYDVELNGEVSCTMKSNKKISCLNKANFYNDYIIK